MAELVITCDGCSKGNPGPAGGGYTIQVRGGRVLEEGYVWLGICTNNQAEYGALIAAARAVNTRYPKYTRIIFVTDSNVVVQQLTKAWKIKDKILKQAAQKFWDTIGKKKYKVMHVYREMNVQADGLADKAVQTKSSYYSVR